jgi:hypothetical protein
MFLVYDFWFTYKFQPLYHEGGNCYYTKNKILLDYIFQATCTKNLPKSSTNAAALTKNGASIKGQEIRILSGGFLNIIKTRFDEVRFLYDPSPIRTAPTLLVLYR